MSTYPTSLRGVQWRKSQKCESGACVGVARYGEFVLVGSTSNPEAPIYKFTLDGWSEFLADVKLGDFTRSPDTARK